MRGINSRLKRDGECIKNLVGKSEWDNHLEDVRVDWRIILEWI
jgi:hypothetical protein